MNISWPLKMTFNSLYRDSTTMTGTVTTSNDYLSILFIEIHEWLKEMKARGYAFNSLYRDSRRRLTKYFCRGDTFNSLYRDSSSILSITASLRKLFQFSLSRFGEQETEREPSIFFFQFSLSRFLATRISIPQYLSVLSILFIEIPSKTETTFFREGNIFQFSLSRFTAG